MLWRIIQKTSEVNERSLQFMYRRGDSLLKFPRRPLADATNGCGEQAYPLAVIKQTLFQTVAQ